MGFSKFYPSKSDFFSQQNDLDDIKSPRRSNM